MSLLVPILVPLILIPFSICLGLCLAKYIGQLLDKNRVGQNQSPEMLVVVI